MGQVREAIDEGLAAISTGVQGLEDMYQQVPPCMHPPRTEPRSPPGWRTRATLPRRSS